MVEELSAVLIKKSTVADTKNLAEAKKLLLEVYNLATEEPYSFLFINLMKADVNDMFVKGLMLNWLLINCLKIKTYISNNGNNINLWFNASWIHLHSCYDGSYWKRRMYKGNIKGKILYVFINSFLSYRITFFSCHIIITVNIGQKEIL